MIIPEGFLSERMTNPRSDDLEGARWFPMMKEKNTKNNNQKDVPITSRLYGNIYTCMFIVIFSGMYLSFIENIKVYIERVYILLNGSNLSFVCKYIIFYVYVYMHRLYSNFIFTVFYSYNNNFP